MYALCLCLIVPSNQILETNSWLLGAWVEMTVDIGSLEGGRLCINHPPWPIILRVFVLLQIKLIITLVAPKSAVLCIYALYLFYVLQGIHAKRVCVSTSHNVHGTIKYENAYN